MFRAQVNTLKSALEGVEKERDYYFSKLREVELLCQEQSEENALFVDRLMEILYASDEQVGPEPSVRSSGGGWAGCHVRPIQRKTQLCTVTCLECGFSEVFTPPSLLSDAQEGAELAEGNGEEAEQQIQEEGGDDQQEEQDEY